MEELEVKLEVRLKRTKFFFAVLNVAVLVACILFQPFIKQYSLTAQAEEPAKETVKVLQVGTSGGIPAIKASVENAGEVGTYTIVITNPKTGAIFSQNLNNNGKEVTFAINNFTENGTYPYTLQMNGIPVLEGGVNLVSTKRTPTFVAQLSGTDLTIDISGGIDYVGQKIFFKSGSYSNSLELSNASMQRAFANAKGLTNKMTFSTEKGDLVTVDISKVGGDKPTTPPAGGGEDNTTTAPPADNSGGSTGAGGSNGGTINGGGSVVNPPSNTGNTSGKKITITLNQKSFKLEETIVATVNVSNPDYAGRSITVRLGADDNSTTALLTLDNSGKGTSVFKVLVPQPSSKVLSATAYSISGSQLDSASANYSISNEVSGGTTGKEDGEFGADVPSAEYVSLDLSKLQTQKATLAWYKGRNLSKYTTKLKVINTTTKDEHSYTVFMPDGDSKIDMNLVYDGPGIYVWELYSGGRLVAKAPYSTPLGVEGAEAVSQNGLPVLKTLANEELYLTHLDGVDPNAVTGATIGQEIGGVTADDVSGQQFEEPFADQSAQSNKQRNMLIGLGIFIILVGIVGFIFYRRRQNQIEEPEETGFVEYKGEEIEENSSGDTSEFEEVR